MYWPNTSRFEPTCTCMYKTWRKVCAHTFLILLHTTPQKPPSNSKSLQKFIKFLSGWYFMVNEVPSIKKIGHTSQISKNFRSGSILIQKNFETTWWLLWCSMKRIYSEMSNSFPTKIGFKRANDTLRKPVFKSMKTSHGGLRPYVLSAPHGVHISCPCVGTSRKLFLSYMHVYWNLFIGNVTKPEFVCEFDLCMNDLKISSH